MTQTKKPEQDQWIGSAAAEEKRGSVRIDVGNIDVDIIVNLGGHLTLSSGTMINLSATGALVEVTQSWPVGTEISIDFTLPDAGFFSLPGTVVRRLQTREAPSLRTGLGIHFVIRPGTDSRLMRWVFSETTRRKKGGSGLAGIGAVSFSPLAVSLRG